MTSRSAYPHTHLVFDETSGTAWVAVDPGRASSRPETVLREAEVEPGGDGRPGVAD